MNRELLWVDIQALDRIADAVQSGYTPDTATPLLGGRMQFSRPEWCEARNAPVSELPRDALRLHDSGRDHCGITNADASVMREPVLAALAAISELPLSAVISHDWAWLGERARYDKRNPEKVDRQMKRRALLATPAAVREHLVTMSGAVDEPWMQLARFADDAKWQMLGNLEKRDPDNRRPVIFKPLLIPALAYFAHFATERLASERAAYQQRRAELDDQINTVARTPAALPLTRLLPLCAQFISLIEPPEATQWALDLAWVVKVTDYDAEQPLLTEQANEATLRAEVLRRLPATVSKRWAHRIDEGDLSAALASVGAVDHPDTPERYLAKVRVWESGEAERERLRQQVAKFRV